MNVKGWAWVSDACKRQLLRRQRSGRINLESDPRTAGVTRLKALSHEAMPSLNRSGRNVACAIEARGRPRSKVLSSAWSATFAVRRLGERCCLL